MNRHAATMKTVILIPVLLATLMASSSTAGPTRGKKYTLTNAGSKRYYSIRGADSVTWDEAVKLCKSVDLKTAVISNKQDNDALQAASLQFAKSGKEDNLWLGATLRKNDLKWVWNHNGQVVTYSNWPEDAILNDPGSSPTSGHNCGYINNCGKWDTWACESVGRVVCQDL